MLQSFYKSPALRTAAVFGMGGVAFSVGNLILARVLSAEQYGFASLFIGLASLAILIAPFGVDYVVPRRGLPLGSALRRTTLATSVLTGLVTAMVGALLYRMDVPLLICLFVATAAGGMTQTLASHFQGQGQFPVSMILLQASNWTTVVAGLLTLLAGAATATLPSAILAASALAVAVIGWGLVRRKTASAEPVAPPSGLWAEAIPLLSMNAASAVMMQLERLVIPTTIGINQLALFGVLAALVGSPFRMIQNAVTFTLVPRLREAETARDRRQLLLRESMLIAVVVLLGSIVIWMVAPYIIRLLFAGRYELNDPLMVTTLISGVLKIFSAFAMTTASTLAPEKSLRLLGIGSWICVGIAVLASFAAARWGLVGVLYAISVGWLVRCIMAGWVSLPYLSDSSPAVEVP